jgi:hypothetical protein
LVKRVEQNRPLCILFCPKRWLQKVGQCLGF